MRWRPALLGLSIIGITSIILASTWKLLKITGKTEIPLDWERLLGQQEAPSSNQEDPLFYKSVGTGNEGMLDWSSTGAGLVPKYTLELGIAKSKEEAQTGVERLHKLGIAAYYTPVNQQGKVYFRIRQGVFTSEERAEAAALKMAETEKVKSTVGKL